MRRIAATALLSAAALTAPAHAATGASLVVSPPPSATVNVCDSATDSLGVRATMPGDAPGSRMFTRFSVQWQRAGVWLAVAGSESPWLDAGPGPWLYRETGWTRAFAPPPPAGRFLLRGVTEMQWRSASGAVIRAQALVTPQTCELR